MLLMFVCAGVYGQKKIASIALTDTLSATAIDRPGDFYAVTRSGQIQKFTSGGRLLLLYKADTLPTLFDPRDGARLFIYYRDKQRYQFLNTSFNPLSSFQVDPAFAIQPWLICPSGEYKLWILDQADNSLKKVDARGAEVEVEVLVDPAIIRDATDFIAMREYQGFVFLMNPSRGIDIFNTLGIHIRTLQTPGIRSFNFLGEDLYYLKGDKLVFFNLFSATSLTRDVPPGYQEALVTEDRLILFNPRQIDIFSFNGQ